MTVGFRASGQPRGRTLLIDGRSGAGKTELARALAREYGCALVHVEHFYPGWEGLDAGAQWLVDAVLAPRAAGERVRLREWDWYAGGFRDGGWLEPEPDLIVEGCGAITRRSVPYADLSLWLDASESLRRDRARERDGSDDWWELWRAQEDALYAREGSARLADVTLTVDGGNEPGGTGEVRRLLEQRGFTVPPGGDRQLG